MESLTQNISVAVRIRPILSYENSSHIVWNPISFSSLQSIRNEKTFEYDKVYPSNSTNQRIFDEMAKAKI